MKCINYKYPECDNAYICPCLMYETDNNSQIDEEEIAEQMKEVRND